MKHYIIIDIETKSTKNKAIVAAIAALHFTLDDDNYSSFITTLDCNEQKGMGRVSDGSTLMFWDKQPIWLQDLILGGTILATDGVSSFISFINTIRGSMSLGDKLVFIGNPPSFDQSILEDLMDDLGFNYPWDHHEWICLRTLRNHFNIRKDDIEFEGTVHHPHDDCVHEMKLFKMIPQIDKGSEPGE